MYLHSINDCPIGSICAGLVELNSVRPPEIEHGKKNGDEGDGNRHVVLEFLSEPWRETILSHSQHIPSMRQRARTQPQYAWLALDPKGILQLRIVDWLAVRAATFRSQPSPFRCEAVKQIHISTSPAL
jgi:hypothetical protein